MIKILKDIEYFYLVYNEFTFSRNKANKTFFYILLGSLRDRIILGLASCFDKYDDSRNNKFTFSFPNLVKILDKSINEHEDWGSISEKDKEDIEDLNKRVNEINKKNEEDKNVKNLREERNNLIAHYNYHIFQEKHFQGEAFHLEFQKKEERDYGKFHDTTRENIEYCINLGLEICGQYMTILKIDFEEELFVPKESKKKGEMLWFK